MEELKMLVEMVSNLPQMAVWVLVGFYVYKVVVVGSIYGVVRFVTVAVKEIMVREKVVRHEAKLGRNLLNSTVEALLVEQIQRIPSSIYIHTSDVDDLRKAIDIVLENRKK